MSSSDSIAWPRKPTPRIKQCVTSYLTTKVIIAHKASYSKLRPKIGCHGNVSQHSWPPSNTWFLELIWAHKPNGISIGSIVAQMTAVCPYTLQWDAAFPLKIAPSHEGSGTPLIHRSLGPPESSSETASRTVHPFLQGSLVWQTDWLIDTPRYSVGNIRPHLCRAYVVLWCGLIKWTRITLTIRPVNSWHNCLQAVKHQCHC